MNVTKFQFSLFGINSYIVWDSHTRHCVIIDPGMSSSEEEEAMERFIQRESLRVDSVINTHLHIDHAFGNSWATRKYGVGAKAHSYDVPLGERMQQQADMFGLQGNFTPTDITTFLQDGDTINVGDGILHVLHVPGHSPGSIVLYDKEDGFIIGGDVLFQGSVGRTDLPGGSTSQLISAISDKLLTLPDETVVYPGHGPATTIGGERRSNPFLR